MIKSSKIIGFLFAIAVCFAFTVDTGNSTTVSGVDKLDLPPPSLKAKALVVLKNKCNKCHLKKNKSVIFTEITMMHKARKINKMVFIKKKMPKDDVTLTSAERKDLRLWLDSLGYTI